MLYDITRKETWEYAKYKFEQGIVPCVSEKNVDVMMMGNKSDVILLDPSRRQVSREDDLADYTSTHLWRGKRMPYAEVSAKTGKNVGEAFKLLIDKMH